MRSLRLLCDLVGAGQSLKRSDAVAALMRLDRVLDQLERELGLSRDDLARVLGVHPRTLDRWAVGESLPQREARQHLEQLLELQRHLTDSFRTAEAARTWLHSDNLYLGRLAPADALRVGRPDRVEAALEALDSGVFI